MVLVISRCTTGTFLNRTRSSGVGLSRNSSSKYLTLVYLFNILEVWWSCSENLVGNYGYQIYRTEYWGECGFVELDLPTERAFVDLRQCVMIPFLHPKLSGQPWWSQTSTAISFPPPAAAVTVFAGTRGQMPFRFLYYHLLLEQWKLSEVIHKIPSHRLFRQVWVETT